jgi:UDP-2,4-diacetamido-2,4,6-trideoxy-beta-L-altropyranose hydrolase
VVDHYGLSAPQERLFRRSGACVVCIDDLANRPHDCELLIDATLGRGAEAYAGLVQPGTKVLSGPDHALLRPEYAKARKAALARRKPNEAPARLLVSLGLMDLQGITGRALNLIGPLLGEFEVDIAVGASATSLTWLEHLARQDPRLKLHVDTRDMAGLIAAADIGIGAGGASTWERATLGLPSISLILAANQETLARELDQRGAAIAVDARERSFAEALPTAFRRLRDDPALRESLSRTSAALCDGRGAERAAQAVLALTI